MTPHSTNIFDWHPHRIKRCAFISFALALGGVVWWTATLRETHWYPRVLTMLSAMFGLFLLVEQAARIDSAAGTVTREGRLFGRYLVWRRRNRISDFTGIGLKRHHDPDNGDTIFVGLRRPSGRLVAIQCFFVSRNHACHEAERAALLLAAATRLPMHQLAA